MAVTNECENCVHEGPKCYIRGDWEEMRSYCFLHRIYEPCRICKDYQTRNNKPISNGKD